MKLSRNVPPFFVSRPQRRTDQFGFGYSRFLDPRESGLKQEGRPDFRRYDFQNRPYFFTLLSGRNETGMLSAVANLVVGDRRTEEHHMTSRNKI